MCAEDVIAGIEQSLKNHVAFERRNGNRLATFEDVLRRHRRQVLENLRDEESDVWMLRNNFLEKIAELRHVSLAGEPQVAPILAELRRRNIERDKAQAANEERTRLAKQAAFRIGEVPL